MTVSRLEIGQEKILEEVQKRIEVLQEEKKHWEEYVKKAPEGKLRAIRIQNRYQYYLRSGNADKNGVYIRKSKNALAADLAKKEYYIAMIREAEKEIQILRKMQTAYRPEDLCSVYDRMPEAKRGLVTAELHKDDEYAAIWKSRTYERKPFSEDAAEYFTGKGVRVRSKSEILIGDALERAGIPYYYEYPVRISGMGVIHPDFLCLNVRTRKEYFWEHNGMMGDIEYSSRAVSRIEKYLLSDICPDKQVIYTFETADHPLSTKVIEKMISIYLK